MHAPAVAGPVQLDAGVARDRATGYALLAGRWSTGRPVRGNGIT